MPKNEAMDRERCRAVGAKLLKGVAKDGYGVSVKETGNLTYGELDWKDVCGVIERFCGVRGGEFWDLGSGSGTVVLCAAMTMDFEVCGGVEIQDSLHDLAVSNRAALDDALNEAAPVEEEESTGLNPEDVLDAGIAEVAATLPSGAIVEVHDLSMLVSHSIGSKAYRGALRSRSLSTYLTRKGSLGRLLVDCSEDGLHLHIVDDGRSPETPVQKKKKKKKNNSRSKTPTGDLVHSWRRLHQKIRSLDVPTPTTFISGDIFETSDDWANADVVLANVLLFDKPSLSKLADLLKTVLKPGAFVVTTKSLFHHEDPFTELHSGLWCRASWTGGATLTIYQRK